MGTVRLDKRIENIGFYHVDGPWPATEAEGGHGAYVMTSQGIFLAIFCEPGERQTRGHHQSKWTPDHEREFRETIRQEIHTWQDLGGRSLVIWFDPGREEFEKEPIVCGQPKHIG